MADVKDNLTHAIEEKDNLKKYLVSDIIRMLLIGNPHLDLQQVTLDMLSKSAQELINMHATVSGEIEKRYIEGPNVDIVSAYRNLQYRFSRFNPDGNGDISLDDSHYYMEAQENFVRVARKYYSDNTLDFTTALQRVRSDIIAQEDLKKSEEKGKQK